MSIMGLVVIIVKHPLLLMDFFPWDSGGNVHILPLQWEAVNAHIICDYTGQKHSPDKRITIQTEAYHRPEVSHRERE